MIGECIFHNFRIQITFCCMKFRCKNCKYLCFMLHTCRFLFAFISLFAIHLNHLLASLLSLSLSTITSLFIFPFAAFFCVLQAQVYKYTRKFRHQKKRMWNRHTILQVKITLRIYLWYLGAINNKHTKLLFQLFSLASLSHVPKVIINSRSLH